ncbi:MAG: putative 2-aminoethylphosphonate transporter, ATP-binding protein [Rhodospirillales bacterium]|nr:putative 2-aminoethylphosphonate transporter, ATP-binding protein [Rhodospirillales bacterium]
MASGVVRVEAAAPTASAYCLPGGPAGREELRHLRRPAPRHALHRAGRVRGLSRPLRLRQDHAAPRHRRARSRDHGSVTQAGHDITSLPPEQRNFGIVFQSYALFPNLSVAENVGYGLRGAGWTRARIAERVAELLTTVGLPEQAQKYPAQLSGGQQRVALARALANEPELLPLDEPLSALDAIVRINLPQELHSLQRRLGVTTIMVTHDQEEAMSVSGRIVVMSQGRIEQVGTPEDIYRRPATPFVAGFVVRSAPVNAKIDTPANMLITPDGLRLEARGWGVVWNSVKLATLVAVIGAPAIFTIAWLLERGPQSGPVPGLLRLTAILPLAIPGLVLGLAYILFFNHPANPLGYFYGGLVILVVNSLVHFYTVGHLTALTAIRQLDPEFESVGASLRVPVFVTFRRVTAPICLPAILDIAVYLFVNAMTTVSAMISMGRTPSSRPSPSCTWMRRARTRRRPRWHAPSWRLLPR